MKQLFSLLAIATALFVVPESVQAQEFGRYEVKASHCYLKLINVVHLDNPCDVQVERNGEWVMYPLYNKGHDSLTAFDTEQYGRVKVISIRLARNQWNKPEITVEYDKLNDEVMSVDRVPGRPYCYTHQGEENLLVCAKK